MRPGRGFVAGLVFGVLAVGSAFAQEGRTAARIVGSSSMFPLAARVAEAVARAGSFAAPAIEETGTGGGFKAFCAGTGLETPDLVTASRRMTDPERAACAANGVIGIQEIQVGHGAVVLAHARKTAFPSLTRRELWLALADRVPVNRTFVTNPHGRWADIRADLPNEAIRVFGPPPTSGTRDVLAEVLLAGGCSAFPAVRALDDEARQRACRRPREDGGYIEAGENDDLVVRRLIADPGALGIVGFATLRRNAHLLDPVPIEGVAPTVETIADGRYPATRPLFLYVKTDHLGLVPGLDAFVAEFTSDAAIGVDGYLTDHGLVR